jgi:hypothetical protein
MALQWQISPKARRSPVLQTLACPTTDYPQSLIPAFFVQLQVPTDMNLSIASLLSIVQPAPLSNGLMILQTLSP